MSRLLALLALLILPQFALAAEPTEGEVSSSKPKFEWTGSTTSSYPNYVAMNQDPEGTPCQTPTCDAFKLKVTGGGVDLTIRAHMEKDGSTGPANTGLRITKPDGTKQWQTGPSGATQELKVVLKKAPAGDYLVELTNNFVGSAQNYLASAELAVPAAAPPAPAPASPTTTEPSSPPPAQSAPETKLTVKPVKARAAKKLKASLSTSAPLSNLTATLARGGKAQATGKLARLAGSGKIALKAKKRLKPGRYVLTVTGTDEQGRTVTGQAPVTIRR